MLRHTMAAVILVVLFAGISVAAGVDGRWQGTLSGPNGDFKITFNFKARGATLVGTVETANGKVPISDGKVDGNKISFRTHFGGSSIDHEGTVSGDTIQLKITGPWGQSDMTLNRLPAKQNASQ